ncbi:MAG: recombination-associated protein RdgC [Pigmentiphaga sp.]
MWFKNLQLYRLPTPWAITADQLSESLSQLVFAPGGSQDLLSVGWASPRDNGELVHASNGQFLLNFRAEKKLLPATVINQVAKAKAQDIEEQQGYKPGRKQMKDIKEEVRISLLPRAFGVLKDTRVWIDANNGWLVIDAAASAKCDEVIQALNKCIEKLPLTPLQVVLSPAAAMTEWLSSDQAPANFTVDQDAELRAVSESGATVRYVRQSIEADEVRKHIANGKQCTRLAMTWADKVSFVLTDTLAIKRVAPLDILKEQADAQARNDDEEFDSDFILMSTELNFLFQDLIQALDGEKRNA